MKSLAAVVWLQAGPWRLALRHAGADAADLLIFCFLLIRPQQRRQREQEALIKGIEKGDDVVTAGGLQGKVIGVSDDVLTLDVGAFPGERVRVKVIRSKVESASKPKKDDAKAKKDVTS
jgi:preprotein translocase subunit YajC